MNFNSLSKTMAAGAVALLMAGCGGGGGDDEVAAPATPTPPAASLQVSGTAATGLALAGADVQVKCAAGNGTATTSASGAYSVSLVGGALPCIIRVTGSAAGVQVTLHSVTEAGSSDATTNKTSAVANVTPLTEIVVAQLTGGLPTQVFANFGATSATQITADKLSAATTTVLATLKDATGLDFGSIDPFKAPLVAATSGAPAQGNAYDKLLDQLGDKVAPEALPQLVTQVATASASGSTSGLQDAMASVDAGSLPGCPAVLGGNYRIVEYFGSSYVRNLNFRTMKITRPGSTGAGLDITVDPAKACAFQVAGNNGTADVQLDFAMGASGVGAARILNLTANRNNIAYVFPVQSHTLAEITGSWTFHQGGFIPGEGLVHSPGKVDIAANGTAVPCDYPFGASTWSTCTPDTTNLKVATRDDGGVNLMAGTSVAASFWGYRSPSGSLTLFGTTNEVGSTDPAVEQTVLVLFKPNPQQLPAAGTLSKYWDVTLARPLNAAPGQNNATIVADSNTILSVDTASSSVVRKRASDGREDTVVYNAPLPGLRYRAQTSTVLGVYQMPLPGTNVVLSVNSAPASTHLYNLSVGRP
ncbi:hypothetical protein [Ramlibacter alkalitolerans]|uniref:Carboxypeptidase regulatory-like domain-containing protein n=1 Tax=Ramlibacter alkalitolerans TaxID=2039631 RepID=A0ABS1JNK8_9BURK|nr:hypothetical protein [Ramlibacter alkalitolerans]MBL0425858.1 hypothetical protein [Ramlibacter alkalitolerans]